MNFDTYLRLSLATAGTLLSLFVMILIVGYRRRRNFERVLFFLALAQFLYYSGILLILNASLFYGAGIPPNTTFLAELFVSIALVALPGLLVQACFAYGWAQTAMSPRWWQIAIIIASYLPGFYLAALIANRTFFAGDPSGFPFPGAANVQLYLTWLACAVAICVVLQIAQARRSSGSREGRFHNFLAVYFAGVGILIIRVLMFHTITWDGRVSWIFSTTGLLDYSMLMGLVFAWVLPLALLAYAIVRYKALGIGSQKNLVYSVSIAFLAVLYLSVVRRVSEWLEPMFPPEATAAFLLFILLAFFEPLQRLASRMLRRGFQEQVDRLQKLSAELQREALRGESGRLIEFAEEHIRQEFGLEEVRIHLNQTGGKFVQPTVARPRTKSTLRPAWAGQPVWLRLGKPGAEMGGLELIPMGSAISGEASAALDFLAEQLPAVIELCRVIELKVALDRELDERERMALVGQMAASISHNLKNPLGSMKTILQVQLENRKLPDTARRDLTMVLIELDRLSAKLNQLLQFARPAVRASAAPIPVVVGKIAEQVVSLLRHDAERRGVRITLSDDSRGASVNGSEEALADILSNLIVNAIEAMSEGGAVSVGITREVSQVVLTISDDGPGIALANRANVFQPFFTTKPSGTGLGLAIVERRTTELGGTVLCESPVANGRGTRFGVRLPAVPVSKVRGRRYLEETSESS
jgi:signal transduction histidine kinase